MLRKWQAVILNSHLRKEKDVQKLNWIYRFLCVTRASILNMFLFLTLHIAKEKWCIQYQENIECVAAQQAYQMKKNLQAARKR